MSGKQLYLFSHHKDNEKGNNRPKVILPLDTLILMSVIAILLFTISFSMGVEKGKKIIQGKEKVKEGVASSTLSQDTAKIKSKDIDETTKANQGKKEEVREENDSYHVQVASFKKENSARKEVQRLEDNGYPVVVMKKGDYLVLYVGGFENKGEAKNNFKNLKKMYKDCIFKNSL